MNMISVAGSHSRLTPERDKEKTEAVERREKGCDQADQRQRLAQLACQPGAHEDLVLAEEARGEREPGKGEGANEHGPVGDRQLVLETAHVPHVLLVVQGD